MWGIMSDKKKLAILSSSKPLAADREKRRKELIDNARAKGNGQGVKARRSTGRFAFLLDGTGSMAPLIDDARTSLDEILRRISSRSGRPVTIRFFVYRDYDVMEQILEVSPESGDPDPLKAWLARINPMGGGADLGEAVEVALHQVGHDGKFDAVLLFGDEPSNPASRVRKEGKGRYSHSHEAASKFARSGIPIHTFVVGDRTETALDFSAIAQASGGRSGKLDGSESMIDMAVMSVLERVAGRLAVRDYMSSTKLSKPSEEFGRLLLDGPSPSS